MGLSNNEMVAVVGGSIGGVIVFLGSIAIILYCCFGRGRKERRAKKKSWSHTHLSPATDSSLGKHSDPSKAARRGLPDPRLDPRIDPRLPKVGSNNLWFGTPSLYAATPSQAYQGVRKGSQTRSPNEQQPINAAPGGHMVYQGQGNMRIYHSQQAPAAMYDSAYAVPQGGLARAGSYMDLYSYPYGHTPGQDANTSRAMLTEYTDADEYYHDRYRERETRRTGKGLRRSQSDVTLHSTRRPKNRKQRKETPFDREEKTERSNERSNERRQSKDMRNSRDGGRRRTPSGERVLYRDRSTTVDVHIPKRAPNPPHLPKQEIQSQSIEFIDPELPSSATDSAKLRAIERNREKEHAKQAGYNEVIRDGRDNPAFIENETGVNDLHVKPYNYTGQPVQYEHSIVAKMAALVDTPKAFRHSKNEASSNSNYRQSSRNDENVNHEPFHAEVSKRLDKVRDGERTVDDQTDGPAATSTGRSNRPSSGKGRQRSRRGSNVTDQDGNLITTEAFEFLDTYSDGETELGSGRVSPAQMKDYDINL